HRVPVPGLGFSLPIHRVPPLANLRPFTQAAFLQQEWSFGTSTSSFGTSTSPFRTSTSPFGRSTFSLETSTSPFGTSPFSLETFFGYLTVPNRHLLVPIGLFAVISNPIKENPQKDATPFFYVRVLLCGANVSAEQGQRMITEERIEHWNQAAWHAQEAKEILPLPFTVLAAEALDALRFAQRYWDPSEDRESAEQRRGLSSAVRDGR